MDEMKKQNLRRETAEIRGLALDGADEHVTRTVKAMREYRSRTKGEQAQTKHSKPKDDNRDVGPSALPGAQSDSDHNTSSGASPPSAKLREKLNKLANQRIDLSAVEFVNGAPELRGGYATVSRALLVSPSSGHDITNQSDPIKTDGLDLPGPAGAASRQQKLALREAEFLVGLSHENVIELEGFVEDLFKDVVWLVFPWAENGNLKNFIESAEWEIPERICL
ncbi:hypothetical protein FRC05_007214, partial [Tulasnella sp. 425]